MQTEIRSPARPPILRVLSGETLDPPPVWLMRQAGRYLPEYRALRAQKGSFLNLCYDPESAAEVTIQPIRRFGFDGAILFSDILVVPHALGQQLSFVEGEGPRLDPPLDSASIDELSPALDRFQSVWNTVSRLRQSLAPDVTLLGFAGSPFTVATYMVAGKGTRDQGPARLMAYRDPAQFADLIARIETATITYLEGQISAGAQAIMLFDSWSGSLAPLEFERWVIAPTNRIVAVLRNRFPDTPIIGFPKGAHEKLPAYARETGVQALGIDESVDLSWAVKNLPETLPLQGNLDPMALLAGGAALAEAVENIIKTMAGRPHIFNLGHGISQFTPIAHVEQLIGLLRR